MSSILKSLQTMGNTGLILSIVGDANLNGKTSLACKMRVRGDVFTVGAAGSGWSTLAWLKGTGGLRVSAFVVGANLKYNWTVYGGGDSGTSVESADALIASISPTDYYIMYFEAIAGVGVTAQLYDASGNPVGSSATYGTGVTISLNGDVQFGNVSSPDDNIHGAVDGIAVYSAALVGADRYSAPTDADANLIAGWWFEDGAGHNTVANAVAGGSALGLAGDENTVWAWETGGSWDGTSGSGPLTAGTATLGSITVTTVNATATVPTGGTAPYYYQWQRRLSPSGAWANVPGSTTTTLADNTF